MQVICGLQIPYWELIIDQVSYMFCLIDDILFMVWVEISSPANVRLSIFGFGQFFLLTFLEW